jgi:hypothetical protein
MVRNKLSTSITLEGRVAFVSVSRWRLAIIKGVMLDGMIINMTTPS